MKAIANVDRLKSPSILKSLAFISFSFLVFLLGKNFSRSSSYQRLLFFSSSSSSPSPAAWQSQAVSLSPNINVTFDPLLISNHTAALAPPPDDHSVATPNPAELLLPPPRPPPPPSSEEVTRYGILDENGTMTNNFEVGDFGPELVDDWRSGGIGGDGSESEGADASGSIVKIKKYKICDESKREYIPCLDNVKAIERLESTEKGERFERHCPEAGTGLDCLVPTPKGYQHPIPWPKSRDEVRDL